jgi:hypothetical protein
MESVMELVMDGASFAVLFAATYREVAFEWSP